MRNMDDFFYNEGIEILQLGCTLPNQATICLHKSNNAKFHPFMLSDKGVTKKRRKDMVGGPSIVFTRKVVLKRLDRVIQLTDSKPLMELTLVNFIHTFLSGNAYGCLQKWNPSFESGKFKPRSKKQSRFENMVRSYFQSVRP